MSSKETNSISHLRTMLNKASWTDDPQQFRIRLNNFKVFFSIHKSKYKYIPRDILERLRTLDQELVEI